jgi:hypothetical protein
MTRWVIDLRPFRVWVAQDQAWRAIRALAELRDGLRAEETAEGEEQAHMINEQIAALRTEVDKLERENTKRGGWWDFILWKSYQWATRD